MTYNHSEYMKGWRARRKASGLPTGGRASDAWWKKYRAKYYADPKNRARIAANMKRYREDPAQRKKHEARWLLNRAVASGRVVRGPCNACSAQKAQAHHTDYSKPLDVTWLCVKCHRIEHAKAEPTK